jgi:hypothetical protein
LTGPVTHDAPSDRHGKLTPLRPVPIVFPRHQRRGNRARFVPTDPVNSEGTRMHLTATIALTAAKAAAKGFSKHDLAGTIIAVLAVALFVWGGIKMAAKAAGAMLMLGIGAVAVILALLFFFRAF